MAMTLSQTITAARQNNLEGIEVLDAFTYLETLHIYNGIGPDRFPEAVRALVTEINELFAPAALIHDLEYYIGGTKQDFTAANDRFRRNCYTLADNAYIWYDPRRYYWRFKAWRFAGYCEQFGWEGFHKTEEECHCSRCAKSDLDAGNAETTEDAESADVPVEDSEKQEPGTKQTVKKQKARCFCYPGGFYDPDESEPEKEQPVNKKKKSNKKGKGKK